MTGNRSNSPARSAARHSRATLCALAVIVAAVAAGCSSGLDTSYGTSARRYLPTSINGVDVLSGMCADAGHDVRSQRILFSSSMYQVQTYIWVPDDDEAPSEELCELFDEWLQSGAGRTLVYVGRSFDAAPLYWWKMATRGSNNQAKRYWRAETAAKTESDETVDSDKLECAWFDIERGEPHLVEKLSGPWSEGIDAAKTEIEMCDRLLPVEDAQELLTTDDESIAWRYFYENS